MKIDYAPFRRETARHTRWLWRRSKERSHGRRRRRSPPLLFRRRGFHFLLCVFLLLVKRVSETKLLFHIYMIDQMRNSASKSDAIRWHQRIRITRVIMTHVCEFIDLGLVVRIRVL
jgi:hypothetical protein